MGTREVVRKVRRGQREGELRHSGGVRATRPCGGRGEKAHQAATPGTKRFIARSINSNTHPSSSNPTRPSSPFCHRARSALAPCSAPTAAPRTGQTCRDGSAADLERSTTHLEPVGHSRQSSASLATKGSACVKVRGAKSLPGVGPRTNESRRHAPANERRSQWRKNTIRAPAVRGCTPVPRTARSTRRISFWCHRSTLNRESDKEGHDTDARGSARSIAPGR